MKFSFNEIQSAFIKGDITLQQFIEVLIDNFGVKKTQKMLIRNLKLSMSKEALQEQKSSVKLQD